MPEAQSFEHTQLKGITVKNMIVTIVSTATIVTSVMVTYFNLQGSISTIQQRQETENRVTDIRLKTLEARVSLLEAKIEARRDDYVK